MTGEKLFLQYAFPCTDFRLCQRLISLEDQARLQLMNNQEEDLDREFLAVCFPDAFGSLSELASQNGLSVWSLANVQSYWRANHAKVGECQVSRLMVQAIEHDGRMVVTAEGRFFNLYNLSLPVGTEISTHKGCVIEQL